MFISVYFYFRLKLYHYFYQNRIYKKEDVKVKCFYKLNPKNIIICFYK